MRRISRALALVLSVCVVATTTQAAGTRSLHHSGVVGLLKQVRALSRAPGSAHSTFRRGAEPQAIAHSRSQQTAESLALPQSAYSPAVINSQYNYSETPSFADGNWFASNHAQNSAGIYESFGMQFGWYQRADWSGTNPPTYFRYQGAKMSSVAGAKNAWSDGISYTSSQSPSSTVQQCSNNPSVLSCEYLDYSYTSSGTDYTERYMALQAGACLAEMTGTATSANISAASPTIVQVLNQMASAAITAMNNTCGNGNTGGGNPTPVPTATPRPTTPPAQTQFSLLAARFERPGAKPDWNLTGVPLTQVKVGTRVKLAMYVNVPSLGSSSVPVSREYTLKLNGRTVVHYASGQDSIDQVDTYEWEYPCPSAGCTKTQGGYKLAKAGSYTFTAKVTVGGKSQSASAQLQVVSRVKVVKKVSFTFNSLQTQTDNGQATTTFHTGQSINLHVQWTISNLKGNTKATITRSLLANLGGQWKAVNTSRVTATAVNGKNDASVSLQISSPGPFQIAVRVAVGSSSQLKTVSVNVIR